MAILRIERGNSFWLRIHLWKHTVDSERVGIPVEEVSNLSVLLHAYTGKRITLEWMGVAGEPGVIMAKVPDSLSCSTYSLEITGVRNGQRMRSMEHGLLSIVYSNAGTNVTPEVIEGEDSYNVDTTLQLYTGWAFALDDDITADGKNAVTGSAIHAALATLRESWTGVSDEIRTEMERMAEETNKFSVLIPEMEARLNGMIDDVSTALDTVNVASVKAGEVTGLINDAEAALQETKDSTLKAIDAAKEAVESALDASAVMEKIQSDVDTVTKTAKDAARKATDAANDAIGATTRVNASVVEMKKQVTTATTLQAQVEASADAAKEASDRATAAAEQADTAVGQANSAIASAQTAIDQANAASQEASEAAQSAVKASENATAVITEASDAAQDAREAASNAREVSAAATQLAQDTVNSAIETANNAVQTAITAANEAAQTATAAAQSALAAERMVDNLNATADGDGNVTVTLERGDGETLSTTFKAGGDGKVKTISVKGGETFAPDGSGNVELEIPEQTTVDKELNKESENAISNKAVAEAFDALNPIVDVSSEQDDEDATVLTFTKKDGTPIKLDPIKGGGGGVQVRYVSMLVAKRSTDNEIVTDGAAVKLNLRFVAVAASLGVREKYAVEGAVTMERSQDNGLSWTQVKEVKLNSKEESSEQWDELDATDTVVNGKQRLRMRATYSYENEDGETKTVTSTWLTYRINKVTLGLEWAGDVTKPWKAQDGGTLNFAYHLSGATTRTLHVKVSGSKSGALNFTRTIGETQNTNYMTTYETTQFIGDDTYGLLTEGVKTIEAWLTASDGEQSDALQSEHVVAQVYMTSNNDVVSVGDARLPTALLVQNLKKNVVNYEQLTLMSYVLTGGEAKNVVIRLTDYDGTEEYLRLENLAQPGEVYAVPATVEIEDSENDTVYAYLEVKDGDGTELATRQNITVDNSFKFAPTSGADFHLNPKQRSNSEATPKTIVNAVTKQAVEATFENITAVNDLWMADDKGERVMRVLAGQKVTIGYDWLKAFAQDKTASVTLEMDFKVSNVTDESAPIVDMSEAQGDGWIGFKLLPLEGEVHSVTNKIHNSTFFGLEEDARVHVAVNIVSQVQSSGAQGAKKLDLCRVFINGVISREFLFDSSKTEWWQNGSSIVIGQEKADIDVYNIRVYKKALSAAQVLQNYASSLPTAKEKTTFREENDILDPASNLIGLERCKSAGKSASVWHGIFPDHKQSGEQTGWWEIWNYDEDGNYLPECSGTIGKQTASCPLKGQGSTAKTYRYFNGQSSLKSVTGKVWVSKSDLHSDIKLMGEAYTDDKEGSATIGKRVQKMYGCGLGKNDWATTESIRQGGALAYEVGDDGRYLLPDGWVDGNKKYRGLCFKPTKSGRYAVKLVWKINYASAMQSHLMGANNAYNDLHKEIVGNVGMQVNDQTVRISKEQTEAMLFTQQGDEEAVYSGPCTWGAGKMDNAAMGYDKKQYPRFVMLEGSDNNMELTDFRAPWEKSRLTYDMDGDEVAGYNFDGTTMWDLDKYKDEEKTIGANKVAAPTAQTEADLERLQNFVYDHNTRMKVHVGTWQQFLSSDNGRKTSDVFGESSTWLWWCTGGDDAYKLRRWDTKAQAWVEAGWDADTQTVKEKNLNTLYAQVVAEYGGGWDACNEGFKKAIAADFKEHAAELFNVKSLLLHYCYIQQLEAGTDNNSKNTYYCLVPDGADWKWCMFVDDSDTIKSTDNSGILSKPYYIDRENPMEDGGKVAMYQGMGNALFNVMEVAYGETGELKDMMRQVMNAMVKLAPQEDKSLMGFQDKYYFSIQRWFPAVAYNEAARLRYEIPSAEGFVSDRGVQPITQSSGRQLESERQFMKRRLVLLASWAGWGDFSAAGGGSVGTGDTGDVLSVQGKSGESRYVVFKGLVPHQWLYVGGRVGQTTKTMTTRCKPGEAVDFDLTGGTAVTGDTASSLFGANYFRSFGNLGDMNIINTQPFTVTARRLTDLVITPSEAGSSKFDTPQVVLNTPLLEHVTMKGSTGIGGDLDLSQCIRLKSVDVENTGIGEVTLPKSRQLESVKLGAKVREVSLVDMPSLTTFEVESWANVESVEVVRTPTVDTKAMVTQLYAEKPNALHKVCMDGIAWSNATADMMVWLAGITECELTGSVVMKEASKDRYIVLADKKLFAEKWGNIDSSENALCVTYDKKTARKISVSGPYECCEEGKSYTFTVEADLNNVAIEGNRLAITFETSEEAEGHISHSTPFDGTFTTNSRSEAETEFTMTAKVRLLDGTELTGEAAYMLYKHIPQVGDFAWGDGSFSKKWYEDRDYIGLVYMIIPKNGEDGEVTGYDIRVLAREGSVNISPSDDSKTYYNYPWGVYPDNGGSNGVTEAMIADMNGKTGIDTAEPNVYARSNNTRLTGGNIGDANSNYVDASTEDGFRDFSKDSYKDSVLLDLRGKEHTDKIVAVADAIIEDVLNGQKPTTLTELADAMQSASAGKSPLDRNTGLHLPSEELYYPAAYVCKLYEPVHNKPLHEQYAKGEWYLPAVGELARIAHYWRMGWQGDGNENAAKIAQLPIFANANKRAGKTVATGYFPDWYWSSTENSRGRAWHVNGSGYLGNNGRCLQYCVLAVAVFDFEL